MDITEGEKELLREFIQWAADVPKGILWIYEHTDDAIQEFSEYKKHGKALLEYYMLGFNDELSSMPEPEIRSSLCRRAYSIGRADAIIGDDVRSQDSQTSEEIMKRILLENT